MPNIETSWKSFTNFFHCFLFIFSHLKVTFCFWVCFFLSPWLGFQAAYKIMPSKHGKTGNIGPPCLVILKFSIVFLRAKQNRYSNGEEEVEEEGVGGLRITWRWWSFLRSAFSVSEWTVVFEENGESHHFIDFEIVIFAYLSFWPLVFTCWPSQFFFQRNKGQKGG